jgi:hypothetical protein
VGPLFGRLRCDLKKIERRSDAIGTAGALEQPAL